MATVSDELFREYAGVLWEGDLGKDVARDIVAFVAKHVAPPEPVALTRTDLEVITTGILYAADTEWLSTTSIAESFIDDIGKAGFDIVRRRA